MPKAPKAPGPLPAAHEDKAAVKDKSEERKEGRTKDARKEKAWLEEKEKPKEPSNERNPGGKVSGSGGGVVGSSAKFGGKAHFPKPPATPPPAAKKEDGGGDRRSTREREQEPTRPKAKPVEGQLVQKSFDSLRHVT